MSRSRVSRRVAFCVFCDDVRAELGNKLSLMGLYSGDMIVPGPPPVGLPKLCVVVWITTDIDDPMERVNVRVLAPPDERERARIDFPSRGATLHQEGATRMQTQAIIQMAPFPLEHEGFIQVMVETERETLRAGRLMVKFAGPASGPEATAAMEPRLARPARRGPASASGRRRKAQGAGAPPDPSSSG